MKTNDKLRKKLVDKILERFKSTSQTPEWKNSLVYRRKPFFIFFFICENVT